MITCGTKLKALMFSRCLTLIIPFLPLMLILGMGLLSNIPKFGMAVSLSLPLLLIGQNADLIDRMWHVGPYTPAGPQQNYATESFKFIRDSLPNDAVILFDKPRALSLYAHRSSLCAPDDSLALQLPLQMKRYGVSHVMISSDTPNRVTDEWIQAHPTSLTVVYSNPEIQVYSLNTE